MREPRVYAAQPLEPGATLVLEPGPARHLTQVLRLRPGDPVRLFNGDGRELAGRIQSAVKERVEVALGEVTRVEPPARLGLHLILGISKGERVDYALQKAVELGVTRLSPVFAGRSVVRLDGERLTRREEHWRGVVVGACEQSGRCRLPDLDGASDLDTALGRVGSELRLLLHHLGSRTLAEIPAPGSGLCLLVGPEGGLAPGEIDRAEAQGFLRLRLGPRILRTETAPLAALAAIQALWGDFRGP